MFYQMITNARNRWFASSECTAQGIIAYIEKTNQMRDAQVDAIKTYLFLERDLSRVFFTKTFAVIYEFIFFNFLIKDRQTSVNLNFHVIKENLKRSKLKLV